MGFGDYFTYVESNGNISVFPSPRISENYSKFFIDEDSQDTHSSKLAQIVTAAAVEQSYPTTLFVMQRGEGINETFLHRVLLVLTRREFQTPLPEVKPVHIDQSTSVVRVRIKEKLFCFIYRLIKKNCIFFLLV